MVDETEYFKRRDIFIQRGDNLNSQHIARLFDCVPLSEDNGLSIRMRQ